MNQLPFDEINKLTHNAFTSLMETNPDEAIDSLLEILIMAFVFGYGENAPQELVEEAVYEIIDGKTWEERVREYIEGANGDYTESVFNEINKVIETESHRVFEEGKLAKAKEDGKTKKTWKTARDDKVRDTHEPLENITLDIDSLFYTWDGDQAKAPGGFTSAENNCNCRCYLEYS